MKKMRKKYIGLAVATILLAVVAVAWFEVAGARGYGRRSSYEVTITNLTRGQILSPAVVATHSTSLEPLFVLGDAASDELAAVAEDAVTDPLVAALEDDSAVLDVELLTGENGPILPGETASIVVDTRSRFRHVSVVSMLVTTNDAFAALNGVMGPLSSRTVVHRSPAYDAGSEANNESCDFIPGPPCGNGGVRDTDGAEGYVHIHAGIHGGGDLDPAMHDWRNPVAQITIRRVRSPGPADDDDDGGDD